MAIWFMGYAIRTGLSAKDVACALSACPLGKGEVSWRLAGVIDHCSTVTQTTRNAKGTIRMAGFGAAPEKQ